MSSGQATDASSMGIDAARPEMPRPDADDAAADAPSVLLRSFSKISSSGSIQACAKEEASLGFLLCAIAGSDAAVGNSLRVAVSEGRFAGLSVEVRAVLDVDADEVDGSVP